MRLRERPIDPEVQRELDALDAALRGERVDPEFAHVTELAGELREARPEPSTNFGGVLDARVATGFAGGDGRQARPPKRSLSRRFGFVVAPVAATMLAVVVGVGVLSNSGGEDDAGSGDVQPIGVQEDAGGGTAALPTGPEVTGSGDFQQTDRSGAQSTIEPALPGTTVAPAPPGTPTQPLKPGQARKQELTASMALSTEPDEVDDVADGVVDVVDTYRGIVVSSNVSTNGDKGRATFDLRIPAQNLQAALADLSDLASVTSRDEGLLDVTAPFIGAEERFDDAKAEVDSLVAQLAEAESQTEIDAIKARLAPARDELAAARAELAGLKQRTDFSRLSVTVLGDGDADGWSIGDAADDAVSVLEDIAGAGLIALAVIIPLGALAIVGGLGLSAYRRRSRERALDR
jgi:hypothetical protein